ncbi:MAG: hypothetical protein F4X87_04795 [Chloroflexi bacterium]|nr:hypothetical protein [Chloroflexota bacterium]
MELEIPDEIADGLRNRTLERFGGVIRAADSKQIVAFLREGGNMSRNSTSTLKLLPSLLKIAGMNAKTVAVVAGAVTVAGPLLDIAITAFTIHYFTGRIRALEKKIEKIYDRIDHRFNRVETAALMTALDLADELLKTEDLVSKREKANLVIARLVNAQKLILMDLDDALNGRNRRKAEVLIDTFMSLSMLAARCSFDVGDKNIAISRLDKNISELKPKVDLQIRRLVRNQPALYFHKSVSDDYLDRYIQIEAWLYGSEDVWERVIKKARRRFWNEKAIRRLFRTARRFLYAWPKLRKKPFYINSIPRAELVIENFQRFESFTLYMKSSERLGRDQEIQSDKAAARLADHDDYMLLIDEEALERIRRLRDENSSDEALVVSPQAS